MMVTKRRRVTGPDQAINYEEKVYLSGSTTEFFKDLKAGGPIVHGVMFNVVDIVAYELDALEAGCFHGVDNGVFGGNFTEERWKDRLVSRLGLFPEKCLVCPLPDWLDHLPNGRKMGDWRKTLDRFHEYKSFTRKLGLPITLVTQDGLKPNNTPWSELDAIFIGGSNYHKRGLEAERLALAARKRGLHVHVGRVSSVSSAALYWPWADSYDGTTYTNEPDARYKSYTPQWRRLFSESPERRPHQRKLF